MARMRNVGGGAASAWALVIFGFGFGLCLVLAIVMYTRLDGAQQRARQAESTLQQYVTDEQANAPGVVDLREGDGTVVGQLRDANEQLRGIITSDRNLAADQLAQQIDDDEIGTPLLNEIEQLQAELNARDQRIAQLQSDLQEARQRADSLDEQMAQVSSSFDESVQQLRAKIDEMDSARENWQGNVEQMREDLLQKVQQVRQAKEDQLAQLQQDKSQLQSRVQTLQRELAEVKEQQQGLSPPDVVRADGQIESIVENADQVYINLGRADQLVLGMTFEVFNPDTLIKPDDFDEVRGKATIEVVEIDEQAALARIVRTERTVNGSTVSEGDQIVNVAYQSDALYTFHVAGKFAIGRTEEATVADRQRIESMIKRWGGQLSEELNYDVDYLVLGKEPPLPEQLPEGTIDPAKIKANAEARREYEQYQELVGQARELNIPILNQNRFLALIGYYQR